MFKTMVIPAKEKEDKELIVQIDIYILVCLQQTSHQQAARTGPTLPGHHLSCLFDIESFHWWNSETREKYSSMKFWSTYVLFL